MKYYVYIIRSSKDKIFYTGITNDINRRLREHDKGKIGTITTLNRGPFELIHVEIAKNRQEARKLEKFFKSGFGREIRQEIAESWWS